MPHSCPEPRTVELASRSAMEAPGNLADSRRVPPTTNSWPTASIVAHGSSILVVSAGGIAVAIRVVAVGPFGAVLEAPRQVPGVGVLSKEQENSNP